MAGIPITRRALIDKTNTTVVIIAGVAAFLLVFSLVSSKTLISQSNYQNKIMKDKRVALNQLKADKTAADALKSSYQTFVGHQTNVIGGSKDGTNGNDGNNANIILDALPSTYDFPAMATSLEKLITLNQLQIQSITGTDDVVAQAANAQSANPQPVPMPFEFTVEGSYPSVQELVISFEHSIRPIQIQTVNINAGDGSTVTADITAQTFYQPAKVFDVTKKVVK